MRLEKVVVEGYRSIKGELALVMDPRVTVLVGANDHGKTNVLEALLHLQPEKAFGPDDLNWDRTDDAAFPRIEYHFSLEEDLKTVLEAAEPPSDIASERPDWAASVPEKVVIRRQGVLGKLDLVDLPELSMDMFSAVLPRPELFAPVAKLPDSAAAQNITDADHEFMRGIFLFAGIEPSEWPGIFVQGPRTERRLAQASEALNETLRSNWSQGSELTFLLKHMSSTGEIFLRILDPSVSDRYVHPSQRSSGFTHYFALKTRIHARQQESMKQSHLWLFDEPGVFLHPSGQFDLVQAIEALAERDQILYATHSVFMINRNYPGRHRLVKKTASGSELDSKPFSGRWRSTIEALGLSLPGSVLFASNVLLTEGDADPILLYAMLQKLAEAGEFAGDLNALAIVSTGTSGDTAALVRLFLQAAEPPRLAILVDGDKGGTDRLKRLEQLTKQNDIPTRQLIQDTTTEDYLPDAADLYLSAVARYVAKIAPVNEADLLEQLTEKWNAITGGKPAVTKGIASSALDAAKEIAGLPDRPSKVGVARECVEAIQSSTVGKGEWKRIRDLALDLDGALHLPRRVADASILG